MHLKARTKSPACYGPSRCRAIARIATLMPRSRVTSTWAPASAPRRRRARAGPGRPRRQRAHRAAAAVAGRPVARGARRPRRATPTTAPPARALAARHGRPAGGAADRRRGAGVHPPRLTALRPRRAVVVHPQFTEPEAALRGGRAPGAPGPAAAADAFTLDPALVPGRRRPGRRRQPDQPDLGAAPGRRRCAALARPGRVLVVDEAFADTRARASRSRWPAAATCPAWSWSAASPRPGAWPGCGSATCSAAPELIARLAAVAAAVAGLHAGAGGRDRLRRAGRRGRPSGGSPRGSPPSGSTWSRPAPSCRASRVAGAAGAARSC